MRDDDELGRLLLEQLGDRLRERLRVRVGDVGVLSGR